MAAHHVVIVTFFSCVGPMFWTVLCSPLACIINGVSCYTCGDIKPLLSTRSVSWYLSGAEGSAPTCSSTIGDTTCSRHSKEQTQTRIKRRNSKNRVGGKQPILRTFLKTSANLWMIIIVVDYGNVCEK